MGLARAKRWWRWHVALTTHSRCFGPAAKSLENPGQLPFTGNLLPSPNVVLLLQVLRGDGDVGPLIARGLEYSQVVELMQEARSVGLTQRIGTRTELTQAGLSLLAESAKRHHRVEFGGWIRPLDEYR